MLAAMYILQRGTPFIYQGQEIGMTNIALPRLDMYKTWRRSTSPVSPRSCFRRSPS